MSEQCNFFTANYWEKRRKKILKFHITGTSEGFLDNNMPKFQLLSCSELNHYEVYSRKSSFFFQLMSNFCFEKASII